MEWTDHTATLHTPEKRIIVVSSTNGRVRRKAQDQATAYASCLPVTVQALIEDENLTLGWSGVGLSVFIAPLAPPELCNLVQPILIIRLLQCAMDILSTPCTQTLKVSVTWSNSHDFIWLSGAFSSLSPIVVATRPNSLLDTTQFSSNITFMIC